MVDTSKLETAKKKKYGSGNYELTDDEKNGIFKNITEDEVLTKVQELLDIVIQVKRSSSVTYNEDSYKKLSSAR